MRRKVLDDIWRRGGFLFAQDMKLQPLPVYIAEIGRKLREETGEARQEIDKLFSSRGSIAALNEEFADVMETLALYRRDFPANAYPPRRGATLPLLYRKMQFLEEVIRTTPSLPEGYAACFLNRIVTDMQALMAHLCTAPGGYTREEDVAEAAERKRAEKGPLTSLRVEVVVLPASETFWCGRFAAQYPEMDPAPYVYARSRAFTPQQLAVTLG